MIKKTKESKVTKVFSLTEFTKGNVKRLTLHIQDVPAFDKVNGADVKLGECAIISGTLQVFKEGDKKNVDNINFTLPLQSNIEFKKHILSIIKSALEAKAKQK